MGILLRQINKMNVHANNCFKKEIRFPQTVQRGLFASKPAAIPLLPAALKMIMECCYPHIVRYRIHTTYFKIIAHKRLSHITKPTVDIF